MIENKLLINYRMEGPRMDIDGNASNTQDAQNAQKDLQIAKLLEENRRLKQQQFSTTRLEGETRVDAAARRLKHFDDDPKGYLKMLLKIVNEVEPEIPTTISNLMKEVRGTVWPSSQKPCINFNAGGCGDTFVHGLPGQPLLIHRLR